MTARPAGSRGSLPGYGWLQAWLVDGERNRRVRDFEKNRASGRGRCGADQLRENLRATDVAPLLSTEVMGKIADLFR